MEAALRSPVLLTRIAPTILRIADAIRPLPARGERYVLVA
jgi:hypothetical protein